MHYENYDASNFTSVPAPSHSSPPMAPAFIVLLALLAYVTYKDYEDFLSLGPGGTPSTFPGYLKITFLRLFTLRNTYTPAPVPSELRNTGFLRTGQIPTRLSNRPNVAGIAPHRQTNQRPSKEIFTYFSTCIMKLAKDYPSRFRMDVSAFEKHCPGLFSLKTANPACNGEICHAHPIDGSMHMTLHPEDIKMVLEAGWGERHPLAKGGWCRRFVPQEFVMVYAPRSKEEVDTVMEIIKAGVGWISGEKFEEHQDKDSRDFAAAGDQMPLLRENCMHHRRGAVAS
ncbi:hypothetical protein FN846DRAFT_946113 [Sphaerosporella brunnea]|uniref:Luciferase domain-containing protein n=1 Tax=Sphaerosporella brunnea TaxID=1250544 RepID=A0A5J5EZ07_9PEZI|nr:hypothetical protein FN846DRAFT_946113 [Sphaerosporella brunnea]